MDQDGCVIRIPDTKYTIMGGWVQAKVHNGFFTSYLVFINAMVHYCVAWSLLLGILLFGILLFGIWYLNSGKRILPPGRQS